MIEAHVGDGGVCDDDCPHSTHAADPCFHCMGHGWFTECVEGSNGRDEDVDYRCAACSGTGVEQ